MIQQVLTFKNTCLTFLTGFQPVHLQDRIAGHDVILWSTLWSVERRYAKTKKRRVKDASVRLGEIRGHDVPLFPRLIQQSMYEGVIWAIFLFKNKPQAHLASLRQLSTRTLAGLPSICIEP